MRIFNGRLVEKGHDPWNLDLDTPPLQGGFLRDRVWCSVTRSELRVEPFLLHIERNQLRWHLVWISSLERPSGHVPLGKTQDTLVKTSLAGLGTPWDPPGELEEVDGERGGLGISAETAAEWAQRKGIDGFSMSNHHLSVLLTTPVICRTRPHCLIHRNT